MAKETQDLLSFIAGDGVQLDIDDAVAVEVKNANRRVTMGPTSLCFRPTHEQARKYVISHMGGQPIWIDHIESKIQLAGPGETRDFHFVDVHFVLDDEAHTYSVWFEDDGEIYGEW